MEHRDEASKRRLVAVLAGSFPALDTAVNVAFPAIDEHFGLDVAGLQWIVVSYLVTYGVLLVGAGRLGDVFGHVRLVRIGGLVSIVGLAGCAMAPGFGFFLVGRVAQGIGTALLLAGAPALLTTSVDDAGKRGRAVSWFQAASMIGLAIGPLLGGPLVAAAGWRAVYWFRVPIAALLVVSTMLGSSVAGRRTRAVPDEGATTRAGFLRLPRPPGFVRANLLNAVANAAMFPTWLLVPTLLVDEMDLAVIVAGVALSVSPAMSAAASWWAGHRVDDGDAIELSQRGLVTLAAGLFVLVFGAAVTESGPGGAIVVAVGLAFVGFGLGTFSVPNMHLVMASLPIDHQGVAGGLSLTMRTLGVGVGVLLAGAVIDPLQTAHGFTTAFRVVFGVAAVLALIGAIAVAPRATRR